MMTALARQSHSRTVQAGLLARAAIAVAAERMGGQPPEPFLKGEEALRAEIIKDVRRRLNITPHDVSDEALRAIEDALDAEMEAIGESVDVEAALTRAAALLDSAAVVERLCWNAHHFPILAVAVTPDGTRAISGSNDRTLKVWDLEAGGLLATLEGHGAGVWAVAVTPDGTRAISGSNDRTLKVWDLEAGGLLATLGSRGDWVLAVAMTPDGSRAVSGSADRTLKVWDLQSHAEIGHSENDSALWCCAVTPDGRFAITGDHHGRLHVVEILA